MHQRSLERSNRHFQRAQRSLPLGVTVAERIQKMVPAAELVRFSNSGTEAVMAALRQTWFISAAHDAACLKQTVESFEAALDATLAERRS